ncbi:glucose 1-dehydrogenase [Pusillimonas sp. TS35]|uniref:SDR family NAD(P)-dependent oxidoreductase n=1 Tax=Paracandidimonas lactea TaxID=2895524 RepID=UPI00136EF3B8|nr:glucose 1-dehydrogenase [Paracandidimonas lactea]MYN13314.1 glucose 1-dehydrogenase [Pusillimonas sp. TS35]
MAGRLEGKTAVVMGAGSAGPGWGNGKAAAVLFAREGAHVVCADRNVDAAAETARIIVGEGGHAFAVQADVTRLDDIAAVQRQAFARFGKVDILNNNVGIVSVGGVVELDESEWDRVYAINLKSCYLAMKQFIPAMREQGGGSIINISSIASLRYTGVSYVTYSTTKAAMNHMTRMTAVEYAKDKVRVNAILPGLMKTPMVENAASLAVEYAGGDVAKMWRERDNQVPMGHMGDAWDVAHAAVFLASDESRYVTGIELVVDGGITLKY